MKPYRRSVRKHRNPQFDRFQHVQIARSMPEDQLHDITYVEVAYVLDSYVPDNAQAGEKLAEQKPYYLALTSTALHVLEYSGTQPRRFQISLRDVRDVRWHWPAEDGKVIFADEGLNSMAVVLEIIHLSSDSKTNLGAAAAATKKAAPCMGLFARGAQGDGEAADGEGAPPAPNPLPPLPGSTSTTLRHKTLRLISIEQSSSLFRVLYDEWMHSLEGAIIDKMPWERGIGVSSGIPSAAQRSCMVLAGLARKPTRDEVVRRLCAHASSPHKIPFATTPSAEVELFAQLKDLVLTTRPQIGDVREAVIFDFLATTCSQSHHMCKLCLTEFSLTKRMTHWLSNFATISKGQSVLATVVSASPAGVRWRRLVVEMKRQTTWRFCMAGLRWLTAMLDASIGSRERLYWYGWANESGYLNVLLKLLVSLDLPLHEGGTFHLSDVMTQLSSVISHDNPAVSIMGVVDGTQMHSSVVDIVTKSMGENKLLRARIAPWIERSKKAARLANENVALEGTFAFNASEQSSGMKPIMLRDLHAPLSPILGIRFTNALAEILMFLIEISVEDATISRSNDWKSYGKMTGLLENVNEQHMWRCYQSLFICCLDAMLYAGTGKGKKTKALGETTLEQDVAIALRAFHTSVALRYMHMSNRGLQMRLASSYGEEIEHIVRMIVNEPFDLKSLREPYHEWHDAQAPDRLTPAHSATANMSVANHVLWDKARQNFMYVLETTFSASQRRIDAISNMMFARRAKILALERKLEMERTDKEKKDKSTREARLTREKSKARTKTPGVM